jgi:hypothetical protein
MTHLRRVAAAIAGSVAVALSAAAPAHAAEALYAVTEGNALVTLHSDSPGALRASLPITGLQESEQVLALDVRPKSGQLYVLGSTSRVYVVNTASGAAHALGNAFSPALAGGNFGLDVDPVADRIRLTSDGRQNLRLNPEDGQVAGQDGNLAYAEGDPGAGTTPSFAATAYQPDGKVFVIDTSRDVLTTTTSANDGKVTTIGPLGVDLIEPVTFDVASDGRAWVAGRTPGGGSSLYLADLATGKLSPGAVNSGLGAVVRGIGAAGSVPDDKLRPSVLTSIDRDQRLKSLKRRTVGVEVACGEACSLAATLKAGGRTLAKGTGDMTAAGRVRIKMARTKGAAPKKAVTAVLTVVATDAAGNPTTVKRTIRFN